MSDTTNTSRRKQQVMVRMPRAWAAEVRRIAARESETQSVVLRRLLRVGLETERGLSLEAVEQ